MRKLLTRLFNIIYLGAAAFALLGFCFEPFLRVSVDIDIKKDDFKTILDTTGFGDKNTDSSRSTLIYRADTEELVEEKQDDILSVLSIDYIADQLGDIKTKEPIVIEIPSKVYFNPTNKEVVKNIIYEKDGEVLSLKICYYNARMLGEIAVIMQDELSDLYDMELKVLLCLSQTTSLQIKLINKF